MIPYILCSVLLMLGIYCIVAKKNLVKIVIGLSIMEYAVNLMLVLVSYRAGGHDPTITRTVMASEAGFVDPLPQALVLTAIVIGLGTTALLIAICLRLYEKYGTFDLLQIRRLKG